MKKILLIIAAASMLQSSAFAASKVIQPKNEAPEFTLPTTESESQKTERMKWWTEAHTCSHLESFAKWMHFNSRSIYGCTQAPDEFNAPERTVMTYNPEKHILYVHLLDYPMGHLEIDFADRIEYAQFLHDGSEVQIMSKLYHAQSGDNATHTFFNLPVVKPDVEISVIEVFLK